MPLRLAHRLAALHHHGRHAVHGIVGLDLRNRQLSHVGRLVHLLGDGLLGQQHLGLLLGLRHGCLVALLDQVRDLLAHLAVGLLRLGGLAPRLLGREARLELGLHVARELALGHFGGEVGWGEGGGARLSGREKGRRGSGSMFRVGGVVSTMGGWGCGLFAMRGRERERESWELRLLG